MICAKGCVLLRGDNKTLSCKDNFFYVYEFYELLIISFKTKFSVIEPI